MAEVILGKMVRYICKVKGWNIATVSNFPKEAIIKEYYKLKKQEILNAIRKQNKDINIPTYTDEFLDPDELKSMYGDDVPEDILPYNFLGPKDDDSRKKGH